MSDQYSGHGWVRRAPGGVKARCGGPGMCSACQADVRLLAALQPAVSADVAAIERELQAQCDRALADTRWP